MSKPESINKWLKHNLVETPLADIRKKELEAIFKETPNLFHNYFKKRLPRKLKKKLKKEDPNWNKYEFWKSQFRLPDPNWYSHMYEVKFETGLDKINTDINVFENPIGTSTRRFSCIYPNI